MLSPDDGLVENLFHDENYVGSDASTELENSRESKTKRI